MEFFKRSIAENMIPFKDSNGGRDDALSLVLTTLVILKPSLFALI
ncbi:hypothetical protein T4B_12200 [Trichinella pseudospiralis]|uniref:Uncharacterized protein n=1 Tax=Trichinella pseudospiralis TaxID=6337 RepID=A0A0V1ETZ4_TRIPS|nr:hypothetical protein T4A_9359 [Trichinella pseudospiralis]KRZ24514.1 hypothetical protein T4B_12200 [Trichinella pseudospiralis]KRZ42359.1 hypothetical protein T4C_7924 [Trichinella pseudospiralis]